MKGMAMHPEFGSWYRLADPSPTNEKLVQRWAAVKSMANDRDGAVSDNLLVQIVSLSKNPNHAGYSEFIRHQQNADASFDPRALIEHGVLARAVLSVRMAQDNDDHGRTASTAIGVLSAACAGARTGEIWRKTALAYEAAEAVRRLSGGRWLSEPMMSDAPDSDEVVQELQKLVNTSPVPPTIVPATIAAVQRLCEWTAKADEAARTAAMGQRLLAEECNMLWWLTCGFSGTKNRSFSELSAGEAAVLAGAELAELTLVPPGPVSSSAFLAKVLSRINEHSKPVTIADAIEACDLEWRRERIGRFNPDAHDFVAPVHVAIQESSKSHTWSGAFATRTGLDPSSAMLPSQLATQVFWESLSIREETND